MNNSAIQELKKHIGQAAEQIIAGGIPLERKGKMYKCPNSPAHKNGDANPSMSWDPEALQFLCFTCGEKIDIYRYYREFEHMAHAEIMERFDMGTNQGRRLEVKIDFTPGPLTEGQKKYLRESRGITEETAACFQLSNRDGNIQIPYFEKGQVTGVKVKNLKSQNPKYFSRTGSKFGLFNKDHICDKSQLIICEGEFDCMTVHQCHYKNAVSVGTGANSLGKLFRQERQFLNSFGSLILLADNDDAGQNMKKAFLKEFPGYKVKLPDLRQFLNCNDVNGVYLKYGEAQVVKLISSAVVKNEGLRNLDEEPYKRISADGKYIPTGLPSIDHAINDLAPGLVTLVTGRSNGGKSTFVNQVMANAIDKENKVLLVSGEGLQELTINALYKAVIGRDEANYDYVKVNKRFFKEPKLEVLKALQQWHKGKLKLFNKGESDLKTTGELFDVLNFEIKTDRPDLVIIDNLMSVLSVEKVNEKLERQADFMQRCSDLAKSEKLHAILVLHPNKTVSKNSGMEFEQISGTQDLANKADNILLVRRYYPGEVEGIENDGAVVVLKNRYFSDLPKVETHFDQESGLLLEINNMTGDYMAYTFRWQQYLEENPYGNAVSERGPWG
ncbi:MAG TPA: AAA family ATPase [Desulfitobacteriaceae bacterium]|nr:AAA family ATPase [Desulfitobacteriaceae bacterium]